ncbi:MAG: YfhO family protein [Deltaproteobacteria bacterium]|nr:YfhO family protein [Deltaproteobacteria bacterium]MBI2532563.1 YfhO family protein [Deltaproteobacteria bacterium]
MKDTADRFAIVALGALIFWFCQDIIFTEQVPFFRDLGPYFYPLRFALYEDFRSGELPLWNRHVAMGFPLLAAFQSGVFYPPHLLLLLLPFFSACRTLFVLHFLIAGVGTYKLCREWKYPAYLSLIGALLFTFGGTIVSLTNLLNHFQSAVWLPWVILLWERVLRRLSWARFLAFTVILTLQCLAGSPEIFAMSIVLVLFDGLRVKPTLPNVSYARLISILAAAKLIFMLLAMAQLLPSAELYFQSRRQEPLPAQEALNWSLDPLSLLNLFVLDKEIDATSSIGTRYFFHRAPSFLISYYLGAIAILGACIGFLVGSVRERLALSGAIILSLLVALGKHTPVYPFLFQHFPLVSAVRFPEKFFFITYALIFYASMRGLEVWLCNDKQNVKKSVAALAVILVAWAGSYMLLRFNVDVLAQFIARQTALKSIASVDANQVVDFVSNLERQLMLFLAFFSLLALARKKIIRESLSSVLLVAAVFVDLTWAHRDYLFPLAPDFIREDQRILTAPESELYRVFYYPSSRNIHPDSVLVKGKANHKEATALAFQNLLPNAGLVYGIDYMQEIDALARRPYTEFVYFANQLDLPRRLQLLRALNVKYLVAFQPMTAEGLTLISSFPQYFSWLYRLDRAVPRVYVVNKVTVETFPAKILRRLAMDGFDPRTEVILDQTPSIPPQEALQASAKIARYTNARVTIRASLDASGILVLADSFYPGWSAYVDGKRAGILRANLFFRAVALPAGEHTVEFRYEPMSFKIGLVLSVTTIFALIATTVICVLRKRSGKAPISVS